LDAGGKPRTLGHADGRPAFRPDSLPLGRRHSPHLHRPGGLLAIILGFVYWVRDIQQARYELTRDNSSLKQAATTDFLTELVNRRYATLHLKRELSLARRNGVPLGFIMMDLDHFKRVNDTFGHQAGDAVLAHIGKVLKCRMRTSDIVVRYGGEEFLAVLPAADLTSTVKVANDLREAIAANPTPFEGNDLAITASFGAAIVQPGENLGVDEIVRRADKALYAAKAAGRNRVVTWAEMTDTTGPDAAVTADSPASV